MTTTPNAWWDAGTDEAVGEAMAAQVTHVRPYYQQRRDLLQRFASAYAGQWDPEEITEYSRTGGPDGPLVVTNLVASNVDTLTSKVAKQKPRARFLTVQGDYSAQTRAKTLQKFVDGQFEALAGYKLGLGQFRDACIFGTGATYWYRHGAEIHAERVLPGELLCNPIDGLYADPRSLYRIRYIDRGVLMAMYPKRKAQIADAPAADLSWWTWSAAADTNNRVEVVEGWHLPSEAGAGDGRRCVVIGTEVLDVEAWERDTFPFVVSRWRTAPAGFWGIGVAEDLQGIQQEVVTVTRKIRACLHIAGKVWIVAPAGREIDEKNLTNELATQLPNGASVQVFASVPPELFSWLSWLTNESYRVTGVSQLAASSQKPAGLDSGKALQEMSDIESERFQEASRGVEAMFLDYARQILALAKDIAQDPAASAEQKALIKGRKGIERVNWSQVEADADAFILQMFSSSSLSTHPAAKMQQVMDLLKAQLIDPAEALRLLEFPDLEAFTSLRDSGLDDIDTVLEDLEAGKAQTPEPFQDLVRLRAKTQQAYLRARSAGAPEDDLEVYRDYLAAIGALEQRLMDEQAKQEAAAAPPMQAPATEAGMPPLEPGGQPG